VARDLDERIFRLACRAVDLYGLLTSHGGASREVARQYFRAATSIGANYAEAAAGQTKADFISRISIARKECRETLFWLRLIQEKALLPSDAVVADLSEARQVAAILTAIIRKARESDSRGQGIT
jgi:four helix bundle protein